LPIDQLPTNFNKSIFFNRPETIYRVHNHPLVKQADIIHLHSVVKFIDIPSFFKNVNKPIIWTLHDMNPFSGGLHYKSMMFDNLNTLENKFIATKKKSFSGKNINVVSPSLWLLELSQKSEVFFDFPHFQIPYCINQNLFYPLKNKNHKEGFTILFVSEDINDPRKGVKYLFEALKYLDKNIQINILGKVSTDGNFANQTNINFLGYINSPEELSKIYSEADIYVISSIEDNLPNTVIESQMCGTPVVGFKTSGVANMIENEVNGLLVETISGIELAKGINKALDMIKANKFSEEKITKIAQELYSEENVVLKYNNVYSMAQKGF